MVYSHCTRERPSPAFPRRQNGSSARETVVGVGGGPGNSNAKKLAGFLKRTPSLCVVQVATPSISTCPRDRTSAHFVALKMRYYHGALTELYIIDKCRRCVDYGIIERISHRARNFTTRDVETPLLVCSSQVQHYFMLVTFLPKSFIPPLCAERAKQNC